MTGCLLLDSEYAARQNGKRLPCERLAEENAKLRELVRDLWEYIYVGTARDGQALHDRTRELGIEEDA